MVGSYTKKDHSNLPSFGSNSHNMEYTQYFTTDLNNEMNLQVIAITSKCYVKVKMNRDRTNAFLE